jgi:hypothetical protein
MMAAATVVYEGVIPHFKKTPEESKSGYECFTKLMLELSEAASELNSAKEIIRISAAKFISTVPQKRLFQSNPHPQKDKKKKLYIVSRKASCTWQVTAAVAAQAALMVLVQAYQTQNRLQFKSETQFNTCATTQNTTLPCHSSFVCFTMYRHVRTYYSPCA